MERVPRDVDVRSSAHNVTINVNKISVQNSPPCKKGILRK